MIHRADKCANRIDHKGGGCKIRAPTGKYYKYCMPKTCLGFREK